MSDDRVIRFGRYSLHPTQGLRLGKREIRVTPKSLSVLRVLAERSGQIVTKDELFERAWPDTVVTDAALTSCVQELRQVLGDRAREPHYIETLHRRGFRFLVPATTIESAEVTRACREPARPAEPIVGREEAIAALDAARRLADAGARQVVVLTGGPGIGKTALVEAFLARIGDGQAAIVARRPASSALAPARRISRCSRRSYGCAGDRMGRGSSRSCAGTRPAGSRSCPRCRHRQSGAGCSAGPPARRASASSAS